MEDRVSLQTIAEWQLNPLQSGVELPVIQRGFVWKAEQIENLWDSLLREYPIGSFLLSKTNAGKYHLLDGQQRATSIFLGFYNPFTSDSVKTWSIKNTLPVLWIDINPKEEFDTRKFLFRITTRSHPWGYQAANQAAILTLSDRRRAFELFQKNQKNNNPKYISFPNITVFPYDTCYPLPFCFFIEAQTSEDVINMATRYLPNVICTKRGDFTNKNEYLTILKGLENEIEKLLRITKRALKRRINCEIISDGVLNEEQTAENPTLFVRINSAGTSLSGDDLIYSIYKAIFPDTKQLVEKIGMDFIPPTLVISLVSRIVWAEINDDGYPSKMNVRQFQQRLKDNRFKDGLTLFINNNNAHGGKALNLFKRAIDILQCKEILTEQIPPVIIKQFVTKSGDLFLFLLYWLNKHENKKISSDLGLKITAKLLLFHWFEVSNIPIMWKEVVNEEYWEMPIDRYIQWRNDKSGTIAFLPPRLLRDYYMQESVLQLFINNDPSKWDILEKGTGAKIIDYYRRIDVSIKDRNMLNNCFLSFINVIKYCRQLVLFAQRTYINQEFGNYNQMDNIEDTNTPWDWDHIYPSEWVYRKVYCNPAIKDWNYTIGNLRAISLEQNRREGHRLSPKDRLSDKEMRKISFVDNDWKFWGQIDSRIYENRVQNHFYAITQRMIAIYEKFWDDMKVQDLISDEQIII